MGVELENNSCTITSAGVRSCSYPKHLAALLHLCWLAVSCRMEGSLRHSKGVVTL